MTGGQMNYMDEEQIDFKEKSESLEKDISVVRRLRKGRRNGS